MKKTGLFLIAALTAVLFSACNDSDGDYAPYQYFVTVKPLADKDYYFQLDNQKTIYPGDKTRIGAYQATEGQRAVVRFNLLDVSKQGYDYNAEMYMIENIFTGSSRIVTTQEELDEIPDVKTSYFDGQVAGGYMTLIVGYPVLDNTKHSFEVIRNEVAPLETTPGYLDLELRHDDGGDKGSVDYQYYISIDLSELGDLLKGKKGITLRVNTQLNGVKYIPIPLH